MSLFILFINLVMKLIPKIASVVYERDKNNSRMSVKVSATCTSADHHVIPPTVPGSRMSLVLSEKLCNSSLLPLFSIPSREFTYLMY